MPWVLLRALAVALSLASCWFAVAMLDPGLRVSMTVWAEEDGLSRVYYSDRHGRFNELLSRHWELAGGQWRTLSTALPGFRRIEAVRLDPVNQPGLIQLADVVLESRWARIELRGDALATALFGLSQMRLLEVAGDESRWLSLGDDPQARLALSRRLYVPDAWRLAGDVARIALPALLLWLMLEWLWPRLGRGGLGAALRHLPEALGRAAAQRPARLILLLTVLIWPLLLATQFQTARVTPFFQGPDETPHTANAFAGFDRLWGAGEADCRQYWAAHFDVYEVTLKLVRRPTASLTESDVVALERIAAASRWDPAGVTLVQPPHMSCLSDKWFFNTGYNLLTGPLSVLLPEFNAIDYLLWLRHGQSLLAALLALLSVVVLARGRCVLADRLPVNVNLLRVWLFLAVVAYQFIPQYLFMSSVVSHAAYLVPPALFVAVSFLFRIRGLTELGLVLAAFAFLPRRAVYALLVVLVLAWYLALWLERRLRWRWSVHAVVAGVVVAALSAPTVLVWLHGVRDSLPVVIPRDMMVLRDSGHYFRELWSLTTLVWSGDFLHWGSFFGQFGWLDTSLPVSGVQTYRAMLLVVIALIATRAVPVGWRCAAALLARRGLHRAGAGSPRQWLNRAVGSRLVGPLLLALVAIPLVVSVAGYAVFELRWLPRYAWGQTVQGRYFLPLYMYPILYLFGVHALLLGWRWQPTAWRHREVGLSLLLVMLAMVVALGYTAMLMSSTLAVRYFENSDVLARYLQLLR
jgi:hypothetical protein